MAWVEEAKRGGEVQVEVEVRSVWAENLESEFELIRSAVERLPYATLDTEFPGVVHLPRGPHALLSPLDRYALLRRNVNSLHLIQLGLTLSDACRCVTWEFNFREFDPARHPHAPDSVDLLRRSGVDLAAHRARGVAAPRFAELLVGSGLVLNGSAVAWVAFHGAYDFGYLLKALTGRALPRGMGEFAHLLRVFFGDRVFDAKHMAQACGGALYGGLDRVAARLGVDRPVGKSHQAGSDSLLTWRVYRRMGDAYFGGRECEEHKGVIFGL
ncbi:probable CCR4-associated factor 1 homolog 11 [Ananas comosus]|uniref:poly(A)-specific ribonuclease n=1 Tax=Ananas comosus TaxID=4615 RepID=A0A6P5F822_ANACO|nr:probable CCR4-associated factor 1 homolog 11 [Ananas comosus]